jgi:hypothetical protein
MIYFAFYKQVDEMNVKNLTVIYPIISNCFLSLPYKMNV